MGHKKKYTKTERRGLPGGPNEMYTYVTGVFSTEGYKSNSPDVNNPFNIIPSGDITMKGVNFPVLGTDNLGNTQAMIPGNDYSFPGDAVLEIPMAQDGSEIIRPKGDSYEYKRDGDKFYTRKREGEWESEEQPDWTLATGDAAAAIQQRVYGDEEPKSLLQQLTEGAGSFYRELVAKRAEQKEALQKIDTSGYGIRVIQYPYGHRGMESGHIEAVLYDKDTDEIVNNIPDSDFIGYINRWPDDGNREVRESKYKDDESVRVVDLALPEDAVRDFIGNAQNFLPSKKDQVHTNLGIRDKDDLPISAGSNPRRYDFLESNCATGICIGLNMNPDSPVNQTGGITDPNEVMDNILTTFSNYVTNESGERTSRREGITKLVTEELGIKPNSRVLSIAVDYLDGLGRNELTDALEDLSKKPIVQRLAKGESFMSPLGIGQTASEISDAFGELPDGTMSALLGMAWEQGPNAYIRENTPFDFSSKGVDNIVPWWKNNVINPIGDGLENAGKSIGDFFSNFEDGGENDPIYVASSDDPRYQKYLKHLDLYNKLSNERETFLEKRRALNLQQYKSLLEWYGTNNFSDEEEAEHIAKLKKEIELLEAAEGDYKVRKSLDQRSSGTSRNLSEIKSKGASFNISGRSEEYMKLIDELGVDSNWLSAGTDGIYYLPTIEKPDQEVIIDEGYGAAIAAENAFNKMQAVKKEIAKEQNLDINDPDIPEGYELVQGYRDPLFGKTIGDRYVYAGPSSDNKPDIPVGPTLEDYQAWKNRQPERPSGERTISASFKKGGTVSWQWKGKTYSGPKIGEDENNIYARTHNGKVKTISKKQRGGSVSEIWEKVTDTPWSQARAQGLTDGSYAANIALRNELISTPSKFKQKPSNTLPPANTNSNAANATLSPEEINDKINRAKDFNTAFGIARNYYGANKIFEYNGKQFGTNLAGETFEPSEEDMINAGLKPKQKEKIYKQNRSVVSPYTDDNIVEFDEFEDFENIKKNNANLNRMDQADLIVSYQLAHATKPYLIVDENAGRMHLYYPGEEQPVESYPILSGSNAGDAQTVTKADYFYNGEKLDQEGLNKAMAETGASSVDALMDMPGYSAKTNWDAGNKTTGAGKFTIGTVNEDSGFYDDSGQNRKTPSFVLKNEDGNEVSTVIHTVPSKKSASRINALTQANPAEMRMTNGCINGMCTDLIDMHNIHDVGEGTEIFILPEDDGNKFVYQNGQLNFRTTSKNRQMYQTYTDDEGNEQRGQGVNRTRNTLNYKPIKIDIDKEAFANDKFTYFDFNDEDEYNRVVVPFAKSLEDNKQKVMKIMQVDGDAYNDIAKVAFGILGNETNFGDTHSAVGNFGRAVNKYFDRSSSSSPDYMSKYETYGADQNENSAGLTQFRWKWVEKDAEQGGDLKQRLKSLGITSNKDFLDAEKAALATVAILSYYYNNRKVDDIMQDLPRHWAGTSSKDPNRNVYTKNVANNAKYFTIKEKTFQKGGGIDNDILIKQAYAESTFRPKVTSSANAKGLTQIRPNVLSDYIKANDIEGDVDLTDVSNAVDVQKWYMNDLYNASFIDKENQTDEVRIAKTLAAYNWGRGNLVNFLNEKKADYDIYKSLDWVDKLPKETKDYVNKILGNNEQFNKDYNAAIENEKYTYILNEYKRAGGEISDLKIYRDYVNGMYDGKSNLKKAEAIYDKLNRVYYHKAGQVGMSAPNYIMSYLDEASM